ncbi:MAG: leucine-rich repeat protein [Treponema sp.]|uniref:leucine-rich repeat protein n=1 Tax=Treponema sp. TaxID=166 RepID=UPI003FA1D0CA
MKFLRQSSLLRLCTVISMMMMIGIAGCKPKVAPAAVYYTITLKVSGAEGGTLKAMINHKPVETGSETNIPVLSGTKISLTAHPREGYKIEGWTGVTVGTGAATAEIVITKDSSVTIKFIKKPAGGGSPNPSTPNQPQTQNPSDQTQEYTVTFSVKDNTGGTLTATAGSKTLTSNEKVKAGTKVRFTANPKSADGYTIGAWTGIDAAAGTGAVELIITQDVNVTVAFVKITRYGTITFGASEGGSISAKVEGDTDNLQSGGKAPYGSSVTFTAIPEDGYVFDRWEGLTDTPSEGTATYTVTGDRYVKAYFKNAALPYLAVNEHGRLFYKGDASRKNEILKGRIVIPESMYGVPVTTIVGYTFSNCTELTEVVIPRTVITIEQSMCQGCTKLKKVTLQGGAANALTTIGENAFYGCYSLEEVRLPKNVRCIDSQAFDNCRSLSIYLPRTIETIWGSAFGRKAKESNYDSCVKMVYVPSEYRSYIGGLIDKGIGDCCYFPGEKMKEYDDTKPIP